MSDRNLFKLVAAGIATFFALIVVFSSFYTVDSGQRALVFSFGSVTEVVGPGLHFKTPFVQSAIRVDVRTQKAHSPASAGTHDLQSVNTAVALNYHLKPEALKDTYSRVGLDVEDRVIDPRIQEIVKAVVARYSAEELLTKREDVKNAIVTALRESLSTYNIVLEDLQITDFKFSHAFDQAIEGKQTAEQNALKAKNDLERVKFEAAQEVASAEGRAKAIAAQAAAIQASGGAEYVQLRWIEKWDGKLPQVSGGNTPLISLPNQK